MVVGFPRHGMRTISEQLFLFKRRASQQTVYKKQRRLVGPRGTRETKVTRDAYLDIVPINTRALKEFSRYGPRMRKLTQR